MHLLHNQEKIFGIKAYNEFFKMCIESMQTDGTWVGEYCSRDIQFYKYGTTAAGSPIHYTLRTCVSRSPSQFIAFYEPGHYCSTVKNPEVRVNINGIKKLRWYW